MKKDTQSDPIIDAMFKAGFQYGYTKSRRHPSTIEAIFGVKNRVEIINLEESSKQLSKAKEFIETIARSRGQILIVSGKPEAKDAIRTVAGQVNMPYVAGRWIGGTLTNFPQIRSRVNRLIDLTTKREKGELSVYTKKERLLIDKETEKLERFFSGIISLADLPKAVVVIDPKQEKVVVHECKKMNIPVVALANTDCDIELIEYPVVGNDATRLSVKYFLEEIAKAYKSGLLQREEADKATN